MNEYQRGVLVAFEHGLATFLRRPRTYVVAALVILPAFLPLIVALVPHEDDEYATRGWAVSQMIEIFYVTGVTPLLALFFAAMLIGEEVETQTISYLLSRPLPRSAWIVGRFGGYLVVTSAMILLAIVCVCVAALPLPSGAGDPGLREIAQYQGAAMLSLLAYGAVCAFLGTLVRHPVVVGVLFIFGWQQIATLAPGATSLLTIQRYVTATLPGGGRSLRGLFEEASSQFLNSAVSVSAAGGTLVLIALSAAFLALSSVVVRSKEYTRPVAVTE